MATFRSPGARWLTTRSPMSTRPEVTSSNPAIIRIAVDLPHPDGPTSTRNSPSAISRSSSGITTTLPNSLRTRSNVTPAMSDLHERVGPRQHQVRRGEEGEGDGEGEHRQHGRGAEEVDQQQAQAEPEHSRPAGQEDPHRLGRGRAQ